MNNLRRYALVLSLYLNTRGLSFILFEGALAPYDWGIFEIRGQTKDRQVLDKVNRLFNRYMPDVLVMQDMGPEGNAARGDWRRLTKPLARSLANVGFPCSR